MVHHLYLPLLRGILQRGASGLRAGDDTRHGTVVEHSLHDTGRCLHGGRPVAATVPGKLTRYKYGTSLTLNKPN